MEELFQQSIEGGQIFIILAIAVVYVLPWLIAIFRNHPQRARIAIRTERDGDHSP